MQNTKERLLELVTIRLEKDELFAEIYEDIKSDLLNEHTMSKMIETITMFDDVTLG